MVVTTIPALVVIVVAMVAQEQRLWQRLLNIYKHLMVIQVGSRMSITGELITLYQPEQIGVFHSGTRVFSMDQVHFLPYAITEVPYQTYWLEVGPNQL